MRYYRNEHKNNSFSYSFGRGVAYGASWALGSLLAPVILFLAIGFWPVTIFILIHMHNEKKREGLKEKEDNEQDNESPGKEPEGLFKFYDSSKEQKDTV